MWGGGFWRRTGRLGWRGVGGNKRVAWKRSARLAGCKLACLEAAAAGSPGRAAPCRRNRIFCWVGFREGKEAASGWCDERRRGCPADTPEGLDGFAAATPRNSGDARPPPEVTRGLSQQEVPDRAGSARSLSPSLLQPAAFLFLFYFWGADFKRDLNRLLKLSSLFGSSGAARRR